MPQPGSEPRPFSDPPAGGSLSIDAELKMLKAPQRNQLA